MRTESYDKHDLDELGFYTYSNKKRGIIEHVGSLSIDGVGFVPRLLLQALLRMRRYNAELECKLSALLEHLDVRIVDRPVGCNNDVAGYQVVSCDSEWSGKRND